MGSAIADSRLKAVATVILDLDAQQVAGLRVNVPRRKGRARRRVRSISDGTRGRTCSAFNRALAYSVRFVRVPCALNMVCSWSYAVDGRSAYI